MLQASLEDVVSDSEAADEQDGLVKKGSLAIHLL